MVGTLEHTSHTVSATRCASLPPRPRNRGATARGSNTLAPIIAFALLIIVWKLVVVVGGYKPFLLPPPETVARSFWDALRDGILWPHLRTTLIEAGYGALAGIAVAFVLGYVLVHIPLLDRALSPVIAACQAMPIVAIAPDPHPLVWHGVAAENPDLRADRLFPHPGDVDDRAACDRAGPDRRGRSRRREPLAGPPVCRSAARAPFAARRHSHRLHSLGDRRSRRRVRLGASGTRVSPEAGGIPL